MLTNTWVGICLHTQSKTICSNRGFSGVSLITDCYAPFMKVGQGASTLHIPAPALSKMPKLGGGFVADHTNHDVGGSTPLYSSSWGPQVGISTVALISCFGYFGWSLWALDGRPGGQLVRSTEVLLLTSYCLNKGLSTFVYTRGGEPVAFQILLGLQFSSHHPWPPLAILAGVDASCRATPRLLATLCNIIENNQRMIRTIVLWGVS